MTNRYNNHDNVCGAVIMTKAVARVHPVHLMCEKNVFTFFVILVAFLTFLGVFKFFELVVIKNVTLLQNVSLAFGGNLGQKIN